MDDLLRFRADRTPDRVAVENAQGTRLAYASLDAAADNLARSLTTDGVGGRNGEGVGRRSDGRDVVVSLLPRSVGAVVALHAIPRAGAVVAAGSPAWSLEELERLFTVARPKAVLHTPDARIPWARESRELAVGAEFPGMTTPVVLTALDDAGEADPGRQKRLHDTHTLILTSGSAGVPRAVRLSIGNHRASARAVIRRLELGAQDSWLASLSFAHVGGIALVLRAAVAGSGVRVVGERFDPGEISQLIDQGRVTHVPVVPSMLHLLLEERADRPPPDSLRCVLVGGAACPPALLERALAAGFPVALTYGLTEAASQVATAPAALVRQKPGTVGRPLGGMDVQTADDGQVLVRGPTVMQGYLDLAVTEPEDTRDTEDSGWLQTGDLGRLDEDGDLWITGRLGSRIVTGGVNVDPQQVEAGLMEHPGVREAVVVGVPDEVWGEKLVAVIEPVASHQLDEMSLDRFSRERLSGARRPRQWVLAHSLPRTETGKPDRTQARRIAAQAVAARTGARPSDLAGKTNGEG
jgi:O-succinylbenzoic acid--CoA ligase